MYTVCTVYHRAFIDKPLTWEQQSSDYRVLAEVIVKMFSCESGEIYTKWKSWKMKQPLRDVIMSCWVDIQKYEMKNLIRKMTIMMLEKELKQLCTVRDCIKNYLGLILCKWGVKVTLLNSKFLRCYTFLAGHFLKRKQAELRFCSFSFNRLKPAKGVQFD